MLPGPRLGAVNITQQVGEDRDGLKEVVLESGFGARLRWMRREGAERTRAWKCRKTACLVARLGCRQPREAGATGRLPRSGSHVLAAWDAPPTSALCRNSRSACKAGEGPTTSSLQIRLKRGNDFITVVLPVATSLRIPPARLPGKPAFTPAHRALGSFLLPFNGDLLVLRGPLYVLMLSL